ncbi:MAG: hypothetical protein ACRDSH_18110 [Pseudonocardiaceae bacterium]
MGLGLWHTDPRIQRAQRAKWGLDYPAEPAECGVGVGVQAFQAVDHLVRILRPAGGVQHSAAIDVDVEHALRVSPTTSWA